MKNEYYLKMLYFNAGKNLLTSNYNYAKSIVNTSLINLISSKYAKSCKNSTIIMQDCAIAASDLFLHNISAQYKHTQPVFAYCDDEADRRIMGVYIPCENSFFYNDKHRVFNGLKCINTDSRYYLKQNGKYSFEQLMDIAKGFFKKC